ncbi:competence protein CoiA [Photobacterium halotolerans]|uniref:competence protein CoiA family protein n=1 Tax=Photobacterium halotolerans TaxID=265726 RepID=UPI0013734737|nr:competence protein CoiA family protein [Photobacterium halotolerans]NAX47774.1 competence protein CoiA [Photobacterium halotolerans]
MKLNLIPFGLRVIDHSFVDVVDVPRGNQCGCICPSCNTPLIAKQGQENQWHFAHASRKVSGTSKDCDFSFFVSVRMMARQIFETGITIDLPDYKYSLSRWRSGLNFKEDFLITKATTIQLENCYKEASFGKCIVDILGEVKEFSLIIYFTHPNRALPSHLKNPRFQQSGILEIQLDHTHDLFSDRKDSTLRHIDLLKNFLQHDLHSKKWVHHPRKAKLEQQASERLDAKITQLQSKERSQSSYKPQHNQAYKNDAAPYLISAINSPVAPIPKRTAMFRCILCECKWEVVLPGKPTCPKCHTHLYAAEINQLNE